MVSLVRLFLLRTCSCFEKSVVFPPFAKEKRRKKKESIWFSPCPQMQDRETFLQFHHHRPSLIWRHSGDDDDDSLSYSLSQRYRYFFQQSLWSEEEKKIQHKDVIALILDLESAMVMAFSQKRLKTYERLRWLLLGITSPNTVRLFGWKNHFALNIEPPPPLLAADAQGSYPKNISNSCFCSALFTSLVMGTRRLDNLFFGAVESLEYLFPENEEKRSWFPPGLLLTSRSPIFDQLIPLDLLRDEKNFHQKNIKESRRMRSLIRIVYREMRQRNNHSKVGSAIQGVRVESGSSAYGQDDVEQLWSGILNRIPAADTYFGLFYDWDEKTMMGMGSFGKNVTGAHFSRALHRVTQHGYSRDGLSLNLLFRNHFQGKTIVNPGCGLIILSVQDVVEYVQMTPPEIFPIIPRYQLDPNEDGDQLNFTYFHWMGMKIHYRPQALVIHKGRSRKSMQHTEGHYFCCFRSRETWYLYDDLAKNNNTNPTRIGTWKELIRKLMEEMGSPLVTPTPWKRTTTTPLEDEDDEFTFLSIRLVFYEVSPIHMAHSL